MPPCYRLRTLRRPLRSLPLQHPRLRRDLPRNNSLAPPSRRLRQIVPRFGLPKNQRVRLPISLRRPGQRCAILSRVLNLRGPHGRRVLLSPSLRLPRLLPSFRSFNVLASWSPNSGSRRVFAGFRASLVFPRNRHALPRNNVVLMRNLREVLSRHRALRRTSRRSSGTVRLRAAQCRREDSRSR